MNALLNPEIQKFLAVSLVIITLAVLTMGGLLLAGFKAHRWIEDKLAKVMKAFEAQIEGVAKAFKQALAEHEEREDRRLGELGGKVDAVSRDLADVRSKDLADIRERLGRIEGSKGK